MRENGELESLDEAIEHLEKDVLPNRCNGNEKCYLEHCQLYDWLCELRNRRRQDRFRIVQKACIKAFQNRRVKSIYVDMGKCEKEKISADADVPISFNYGEYER